MYNFIALAISIVLDNFEEYVNTSGKFSRKSKWDFKDYVHYILFNHRKTSDVELGNYIDNAPNLVEITKQAISKQRIYIKPQVFIDIAKQYLINIHYKNIELYKTFKGFRLIAIDGSDFELPDNKNTREEFKVKKSFIRKNPAQGKFSSAMDVLNGFILDGIMDDFKKADLSFATKHIDNCKDLVNYKKTIFIFDRGYVSLELYTHLLSKNTFFVSRIRKSDYKNERKQLQSLDGNIKIKTNSQRLKLFKNKNHKNKYNNEHYLKLRLVTVYLPRNQKEYLLTNLSPNKFTYYDIMKIYGHRWGIESNYKKMKGKLQIENYTGIKRINIEQDIYARFLIFNIFCFMKPYSTELINKNMRKKGNYKKYIVRESTLIGRLIKDIPIMILNNTPEVVRYYLNKIIHWSLKNPKLDIKNKSTKRKRPLQSKYKHNNKLAY